MPALWVARDGRVRGSRHVGRQQHAHHCAAHGSRTSALAPRYAALWSRLTDVQSVELHGSSAVVHVPVTLDDEPRGVAAALCSSADVQTSHHLR